MSEVKYYIKSGNNITGPFSKQELLGQNLDLDTWVRKSTSFKWTKLSELPLAKPRTFRLVPTIIVFLFVLAASILIARNYDSIACFFTCDTEKNILEVNDSTNLQNTVQAPPLISYDLSSHKKKPLKDLFRPCKKFKRQKKLIKACDYSHPIVRKEGILICKQSPGDFNIGQICDLYDYCQEKWQMTNQTITGHSFSSASNTILHKYQGDSDEFAILMSSFIQVAGGEARINYAYSSKGNFVFAEVNLGHDHKEIINYIMARYGKSVAVEHVFTTRDKEGNHWLNLDYFAKYPGGVYRTYKRGFTYNIYQNHCNEF